MANEQYTFGESEVRRIAAVVRRVEREPRPRISNRRRSVEPGIYHSAIAKTTTVITARNGNVPGTGTARIYEPNSGGTLTITDIAEGYIYNLGESSIANATYVIVVRDRVGDWWSVGSGINQLLGKTDSVHDKGNSGTVSIWSGTPGSETDTTMNVTAYNPFSYVASGKWVWVANNGSGWYLVSAECAT